MGLKDIFQEAAQVIIQAFDDVPKACSYVSKGNSLYNPDSGEVFSTDTTYTNINVIFDDYESDEKDNNIIRETDKKALVAMLDLAPTPKTGDELIDPDGVTWLIESIGKDPADALYTFQVRKP